MMFHEQPFAWTRFNSSILFEFLPACYLDHVRVASHVHGLWFRLLLLLGKHLVNLLLVLCSLRLVFEIMDCHITLRNLGGTQEAVQEVLEAVHALLQEGLLLVAEDLFRGKVRHVSHYLSAELLPHNGVEGAKATVPISDVEVAIP